ncbi:hypothetical protein [Rodentibacter myodis]|uniref:Uncharacterized protein n=1 Tax=Rodentibacter myodis TaxID=1907939 RepID=A0A1V3JLR7_9PAST|nr:hypothetical protein [Rodentibacter myodis]OOF57317.1 hypothetical protein BKL49_09560 [Rodentibacter myodis]
MTKNKPTLPPRKWYSLQQAADKLSQIFNQPVTSGDLLHYANQGLIELSVRIDFEKIDDDFFKINIHNSNLEKVLDDIYDLDVHCWQGYIGKTNFIKTDRFKAILNDTFNFEDVFNKMQSESMKSEMGLVDSDVFLAKINNETIPVYDGFVNDDFYMGVRTNIEKLNGFFAIEFNDFEEILIDENNPEINLKEITFRASRNDNINNGFGFSIDGMNSRDKQIIELNKDSIFIVPEELELFANGGKPLRNLNSFENFIEEWKNPTRTMKPETVVKENVLVETETLKIFELKTIPYFNQIDAQNEEFNSTQTEKSKGGRPSIKYKDQIIELAQKIFKAYPHHNRERISDAILELINNQNYFNDLNFTITPETTKKILRENEIGKPRGESSKIKALAQFK